jgi:hypothetical protein
MGGPRDAPLDREADAVLELDADEEVSGGADDDDLDGLK